MKKKIIMSAVIIVILMAAMGLGGRFIIGPMLDRSMTMDLSVIESDQSDENMEKNRLTESYDQNSAMESDEESLTDNNEGKETDVVNDFENKENEVENESTSSGLSGEISGSGNSSAGKSDEASSSTNSSSETSGGSSESVEDKIMDAASSDEIAQGSAILSKIDTGKFFSLMETDKAAAKEYLYSCLSPSEISTALELYSKYSGLLN